MTTTFYYEHCFTHGLTAIYSFPAEDHNKHIEAALKAASVWRDRGYKIVVKTESCQERA